MKVFTIISAGVGHNSYGKYKYIIRIGNVHGGAAYEYQGYGFKDIVFWAEYGAHNIKIEDRHWLRKETA